MLEKLYKSQGLTIYQIAEAFDCSPALISKRMRTYNISTWWRPVNISKEELSNLYENRELTVAQIAKRYGCVQSTIVRKLQLYGIKSRKKTFNIPESELEKLYKKEKLLQRQIGKIYKCTQATISKKMKLHHIGVRTKSEISTKYSRYNFSGDLIEKAYMIGFRLGDLHVRKHRKLLLVQCTTTRFEQVKVIEELFSNYGHVHTKMNGEGRIKVYCHLDDSFAFLLEKRDKIREWIIDDDNLFLSFLAGYIDAEGCIGTYWNRSKKRPYTEFLLRTYDKNILAQIWTKLTTLGINSPKPRLCTPKGTQNNKEDFWILGVYRKDSLRRLFNLVKPYIRHQKRKDAIKQAGQVAIF